MKSSNRTALFEDFIQLFRTSSKSSEARNAKHPGNRIMKFKTSFCFYADSERPAFHQRALLPERAIKHARPARASQVSEARIRSVVARSWLKQKREIKTAHRWEDATLAPGAFGPTPPRASSLRPAASPRPAAQSRSPRAARACASSAARATPSACGRRATR